MYFVGLVEEFFGEDFKGWRFKDYDILNGLWKRNFIFIRVGVIGFFFMCVV